MLWSFFPMLGKTHSSSEGWKTPPHPPLSWSHVARYPSSTSLCLPSLFFLCSICILSSLFSQTILSSPLSYIHVFFSLSLSLSLSEDLSHFWLTRPQVSSYCCQQSQHAPGLWNTQQWASKVLFRSLSWLLWLGKSQRVGLCNTDR